MSGDDGALLDVYYDEDADTLTLVQVNTYVGKIAAARKATSTRDAYVTLDVSDSFTGPGGTYDTDDFSKDDIVYYTYSLQDRRKVCRVYGLGREGHRHHEHLHH